MKLKVSFSPITRLACLWITLCPTALPSSGASHRQPAGINSQYVIRFDGQLHFADDLKLRQTTDTASVSFKCESGCEPVSGSALHLFLSHSAVLDGSRSFMAISLNYGVLRSLQLDEKDEKTMEVVVPLPANQLKSVNQLAISVEQYPVKSSADSEVWTMVGSRSFIVIQCQKHYSRLDLQSLPAPLLDPYSYGPKRLALLLPENPSPGTLEATALLVANLSARAAPDPVSIDIIGSVKAARSPLLIVGTPWEQPQLASMQGRAPFVLYEQNGVSRVAPVRGPRLGDGEGAAGLFRFSEEDPNPVLCVVGNSPAAVLRAARALCRGDADVSGSLARISGDATPPAIRPRSWRGFIPTANRFTLADLRYKEIPLDSQNGFSATIGLNAPPDASFLGYGHQVSLVLSAGSSDPGQKARLEVSLNNTLVGRLESGKIPAGHSTVKIQIAANLLKISNSLKISLNTSPPGGSLPQISIMPESAFSLPRDYAADLPDLALLRHQFFPFSVKPDLSDTLVLVPNDIDRDIFGLLMEFAVFLGKSVPSDYFDFRVRQRTRLTDDEISSRNLINFQIDSVGRQGMVPASARRSERKVLVGAPYVQETISPGDSTKCVLTISADSSRELARLAHGLFSNGDLDKLSGDTAYWTRRDIVCTSRSPKRRMSTTFYLTDLEIWLRVNWIVLPLILTGASAILFVGMRLILDRYKRSG